MSCSVDVVRMAVFFSTSPVKAWSSFNPRTMPLAVQQSTMQSGLVEASSLTALSLSLSMAMMSSTAVPVMNVRLAWKETPGGLRA